MTRKLAGLCLLGLLPMVAWAGGVRCPVVELPVEQLADMNIPLLDTWHPLLFDCPHHEDYIPPNRRPTYCLTTRR